jgi:A/G-specific adenine glycosylase
MGYKIVTSPAAMRREMLVWYDRHRRVLPWRAKAGQKSDPYHVWLSEIMLQQTTVVTVGPYFMRFLERWPTIDDLAAADLDEVLHGWQGLGYYARARNLHRCAKFVAEELDGVFPGTEAGLQALPGIGAYTAAAISAIAFGRPANVVDGNIERVMARFFAVEQPLPDCKEKLRNLAGDVAPKTVRGRPGDFAQAVMDLGATVCTPRKPKCSICPWQRSCAAKDADIQEDLPRRQPKKVKPVRRGVVFWVMRDDGSLLLRRRPEKGLLGGMIEVPSTDWREGEWTTAKACKAAPVDSAWTPLPGMVRHTFTHFHLELSILATRVDEKESPTGAIWSTPDRLGEHALPTVMKKVVNLALKAG